jgi:hypothetical protein
MGSVAPVYHIDAVLFVVSEVSRLAVLSHLAAFSHLERMNQLFMMSRPTCPGRQTSLYI